MTGLEHHTLVTCMRTHHASFLPTASLSVCSVHGLCDVTLGFCISPLRNAML